RPRHRSTRLAGQAVIRIHVAETGLIAEKALDCLAEIFMELRVGGLMSDADEFGGRQGIHDVDHVRHAPSGPRRVRARERPTDPPAPVRSGPSDARAARQNNGVLAGSLGSANATTETTCSLAATGVGISQSLSAAGPCTTRVRSSTVWRANSGCCAATFPPATPLGYIHSSKIHTSSLRRLASSTATRKSAHHRGPR